jgi:hypothetical protein
MELCIKMDNYVDKMQLMALHRKCERGCDPMEPAPIPLSELANYKAICDTETPVILPSKRPFEMSHTPLLTFPNAAKYVRIFDNLANFE